MNEHKCMLRYDAVSVTGNRAWRVVCPTCGTIGGVAFPELGFSSQTVACRAGANHMWRKEWIPRLRVVVLP